MVETPVLYITFARPEYARQSFDAIKKAKPKTLYFYSNKGRNDKVEEVVKNDIIRNYIKEIDWDCNVHTYFRDEYVDIYTSLWGAIDWVFDNEEEAIIIEEDVVGSLAFFDFCDKLIPKYRGNKYVWMIGGRNYTPEYSPCNLSYFASRYIRIMGWAGWANRWKSMDRKMEYWPVLKNSDLYKKNYSCWLISLFYKFKFNTVYKNYDSFNPWDTVFSYNMIKNKSYCILPSINLVKDIGHIGVHHIGVERKTSCNLPSIDTFCAKTSLTEIIPTSYDLKHFRYFIIVNFIFRRINIVFKWLHLR